MHPDINSAVPGVTAAHDQPPRRASVPGGAGRGERCSPKAATVTPAAIVIKAEQLLVEVERAVSAFPKRCKHTLGQDLRQWAYQTALLAQHAWRAQNDKPRQSGLLQQLIRRIDELKLGLQVGHKLQAFTSHGAFEALARLAVDVGRQAGGWFKHVKQHLMGQSPHRPGDVERAPTLSTHATPAPAVAGVNP